MEYHNPNDYWMPDISELTEEEQEEVRAKTLLCGCGMYVVLAIVLFVAMLFSSCATTKYVPVHDTHDVHHWHTDSVVQADTTIIDRQTVIMQLDSEAMAKYGIQLKDAERAWLVKTQEMERQLRQLERLSADRDTVRDSIQVPYPVEVIKEVEKPLAWWQKGLMWFGVAFVGVILLWIWRTK